MEAIYTDQIDGTDMVCPYCGNKFQPEAEDYSEDIYVEECEKCGKKYYAQQIFIVNNRSAPNCRLNNKEHVWVAIDSHNSKLKHNFCSICGFYRRILPYKM